MDKISIVTGTLNRCHLLPNLLQNTILSNDRLELVLVDGGSTDGTLEYLRSINSPQLKVIEYGQRSSYPHFMNLGIKNSSHELVCQWNDDVLLLNDWQDVFDELVDAYDVYLFTWQYSNRGGWNLLNDSHRNNGEVVMNYGIYRKDVFRKCGLYNTKYKYYCADGEMSLRAWCSGFAVKNCHDIRVCVLPVEKNAIHDQETSILYYKSVVEYHKGNIDKDVELLT